MEVKPSKSPDYSPSVFKHDEAGGNKRKLSIEHYNRAKKKTTGSDDFSADRGFTIKDDFVAACSAKLIILAFTKGKSQLSAKKLKLHVKLPTCTYPWGKSYWTILDGPIPITVVK